MGRQGLMDDCGYHGFDGECPEEPNKDHCEYCAWWNKDGFCEQLKGTEE